MQSSSHIREVLALCAVLLFALGAAHGQSTSPTLPATDESIVGLAARRQTIAKLQEDSRRLTNTGASVEAARALARAGRLQLKIAIKPSDVAAALESFRQAQQLNSASTPDAWLAVDILNGLSEALSRQGSDDAEQTITQALKLSQQYNYSSGEAQAWLNLAAYQCAHVKLSAALESTQKSLALWKTSSDQAGLARAYSQLAVYHFTQGDYAEALRNYTTALQLWRALGNLSEQAEALIMLGFVEHRRQAWQKSVDYYMQAQALLVSADEPYKLGQITSGLGEALNESGLPEQGLLKHQDALKFYLITEDAEAILITQCAIGRTYALLGRDADALLKLQATLQEAQAKKLIYVEFLCYQILGTVYRKLGYPDEAIESLQNALRIAEKELPAETALLKGLLGQAHAQAQRYEQAQSYYQQSLATYRKTSDQPHEAALLFLLGKLAADRDQPAEAEKFLRDSLDRTEKLRGLMTRRDLATAFSASLRERYETYIDCLMQQGRTVKAFEQNELAQARTLAEMLRETQTGLLPGVPPELATRERDLRQKLRVQNDALTARLIYSAPASDVTQLKADIMQLENEHAQIKREIAEQYPATRQISQPAVLTLPQIQAQVIQDNDTVLLAYSLGTPRSYVWVVTRNSLTGSTLADRKEINRVADELHKRLSDTSLPNTDAAVAELSQLVLAPIAAHLNKKRIIIVADGMLHYLPFQILTAPATDAPLLAQHEIINAPSASVLSLLAQEKARRPPAENSLAAFGDPIFRSNYAAHAGSSSSVNPLPAITKDISNATQRTGSNANLWQSLRDADRSTINPENLRGLFYSAQELNYLHTLAPDALIAAKFDATRARLQQTDLSRYRILHFATHALLNEKHPPNSGLIMSLLDRDGQPQEGFVSLSDIYNLRAPLDLVVLGACRTGLGQDVRGEGLIGLTRGFMYAGASSVAATLWQVDDEATAELMKQFYANMLEKGLPPATALSAAQNYIRQQPQWHAPFYWAAFTFQGEFRQSLPPAPPRSSVPSASPTASTAPGLTPCPLATAGALGLLLLATLAVLWRRHRAKEAK